MAINLSTAGIMFAYAVETTAGTRPTTGYTRIKGIKSTPDFNPAPDSLETTTLDETEFKTYIDGLKDVGGAVEFTFNLTEEFMDNWETLMTAYETAKVANKATWFTIIIPGLTNAFFFTGNPSDLGMPETSVNEVLEITAYVTPTNAPEKFEKPTLTEAGA